MQQRRLQAVGGARQGPLQSLAPSPRQPWAWAWALVMVMVMGLAPAEASMDRYQLEAMVRSNTHSLVNMKRYLKQTDKFWNWYQLNHRRLNQLLAQDLQPTPLLPGAASDSHLQELYGRLDTLQVQFEDRIQEQGREVRSLKAALQEGKADQQRLQEDLRHLRDDLRAEKIASAKLRDDLSRTQQALRTREEALEEKVGAGVHDDVIMFVKNLAKQANRSQEDLHAEVRELRDHKVSGLAADLAAMNSTTQENQEATRRQQMEIREQLNEYRNKLSTLEEQLENERQKSAEDRRQLTEEVASLVTTLDQVRANSSQLQKDISQVTTQVTGAEDLVLGKVLALEDLSHKVDVLQSANLNINENVNSLVQAVIFPMEDQIHQNNGSAERWLLALDERVAVVEGQVRSLRTKVATHKSLRNGQQLQGQLTSVQTSISRIQGDVSQLDGRLGSKEGRVDSLESQLSGLQASDGDIRSQLQRVRQRVTSLESQSRDVNTDVQEQVGSLAERLDDLEENMKKRNAVFLQGGDIFRETVAGPSNVSPSSAGSSTDYLTNMARRVGPPGDQGSPSLPASLGQGTQGSPGTPGGRGAAGSPGTPGSRGTAGSPGTPGSRGAAGSPGTPGSRGAAGSPGTPGSRGAAGSPGTPGDRGAAGAPGRPGSPGLPGQPGRQGTPGNRGSRGRPGPRGPPGPAG